MLLLLALLACSPSDDSALPVDAGVAVGDVLPDVTLLGYDGEDYDYTLSELVYGVDVLLVFSAAWSDPCSMFVDGWSWSSFRGRVATYAVLAENEDGAEPTGPELGAWQDAFSYGVTGFREPTGLLMAAVKVDGHWPTALLIDHDRRVYYRLGDATKEAVYAAVDDLAPEAEDTGG